MIFFAKFTHIQNNMLFSVLIIMEPSHVISGLIIFFIRAFPKIQNFVTNSSFPFIISKKITKVKDNIKKYLCKIYFVI